MEIGGKRLGCLVYADDDVLMAQSKTEMEGNLHLADEYGKEWDLEFSKRKINVRLQNSAVRVGINGYQEKNVLEIVNKYVYLGMEVDKEEIGGE